ncbi:MAG: aminotransferase class V-fold PLP-dependent enzyme [Cyanobacteria bacterium P01_D01_bin.105]
MVTSAPQPTGQSRETSTRQHREQFSSLKGKRYFNYGGQGPMADSAIAAITRGQQEIQTRGPFSGAAYEWITAQGEGLRGVIARSLGATPDTVTLTENVTVGCNIPLWGLPWQSGDHILIGDCEHPGIVAAVNEICRRYGVEVSTCALSSLLQGADPVDVIAESLRPNTRLVVISHILWNTGHVLPLKDIVSLCHSNAPQTRVLVDAAQSAGSLPLDQSGQTLPETQVDYYAFTGHKWLCGPAGIGALYTRAAVIEETAPTYIGWRGVQVDDSANPTGWEPGGRRYEVATSNYPLWCSLQQAMAIQDEWGTSTQRYERICKLSERLWSGLQVLPNVRCLLTEAPPKSGLVSFQVVNDVGHPIFEQHTELVKTLEAQKAYTRTLLAPNCVRACVHYLSLESEVDELITTVRSSTAN